MPRITRRVCEMKVIETSRFNLADTLKNCESTQLNSKNLQCRLIFLSRFCCFFILRLFVLFLNNNLVK